MDLTLAQAFTDGQDVTLTAKPGGGFAAGTWADDCAGGKDVVCDLGTSGDAVATANFNPKSGTTQIRPAQVGPGEHGGIKLSAAHVGLL